MQTRGHKADFAHFLIESGEQLLSLLWPAADARRAASLEIIARTAYTAEESACHYLETIGLDQSGAIRKTLELARRQDSNEQTHCLLYTSPSPRDGLLSRMPSSA